MTSKSYRRFGRWSLDRRGSIEPFAHVGTRPENGGSQTPLEEIFWSNQGTAVHKWHHYLPLYDRYFQPYRNKPVRMLEIGVFKGGSLAMWRQYFGPKAVLFGIDIDPSCEVYNGRDGEVRIGSQTDHTFLESVIAEMGGVDIVLDDGSHRSEHIRCSFDRLFPMLENGGLYVVEDLHAAYWRKFGGGYRSRNSFMNDVKTMIDDIHHWYHQKRQRISAAANHLAGIHVHDSIVFFEKQKVDPPRHTVNGSL